MIPQGPIARATLQTSLVLGLRLVVQAGTLLLLTRMLEPEQFGAFAALAALAALLGTMATFGTHLTVLRELSQDPSRRDKALPSAFGTTATSGALLLTLYLALSATWLRNVNVAAEVIICIAMSELLLQPFLSIVVIEWHASNRIARAQLLLMSPRILQLGVAATISASNTMHPLVAYAPGHLLAAFVALCFALNMSPNPWPRPHRWRIPSWPEWRANSGYAFLSITGTGPVELDKALAARLLPLDAAGVYAASSRVIGAISTPVLAMMLSVLPRLFHGGAHRSRHLLRWIFLTACGYGIVAGVAIWWAAPFIEWLFGSRYEGITQNIRWLAVAVPGMSMRFASTNALTALGRPWQRISIELVGLAMMIALSYSLASPSWPQGLIVAIVSTEWAIALWGWTALLFYTSNTRCTPRGVEGQK